MQTGELQEKNRSSHKRSWQDIVLSAVLTILGIACFPANPLVFSGIIEVDPYPPLFILGLVVWAFGMVLVMAPIVSFPRRGGVPKGKSFVNTTQLVDSGIYAVIRHPQYTGGVYAIFVTTLLWYPHWVFGVLGGLGIVTIYVGCRLEDRLLIEKFGDDYKAYMNRVPGMNLVLGLIRLSSGKQDLQR